MLLGTNDGTVWRTVPPGAERYYALVVEVREVRATKAPGGTPTRPTGLDRLVESLRG